MSGEKVSDGEGESLDRSHEEMWDDLAQAEVAQGREAAALAGEQTGAGPSAEDRVQAHTGELFFPNNLGVMITDALVKEGRTDVPE